MKKIEYPHFHAVGFPLMCPDAWDLPRHRRTPSLWPPGLFHALILKSLSRVLSLLPRAHSHISHLPPIDGFLWLSFLNFDMCVYVCSDMCHSAVPTWGTLHNKNKSPEENWNRRNTNSRQDYIYYSQYTMWENLRVAPLKKTGIHACCFIWLKF